MPRLDPFAAVRYRTGDGRLDEVVAPPYDVVSPEERDRLASRSEHNAVRLEVPAREDGRDRYEVAASLWQSWRQRGVLVTDDEPCLYLYRVGFHDEAGRPRQTGGVIGALELTEPGRGILPHERTTAKDKSDRLALLRACRANLSPIWTLSPVEGLSTLCEPTGPPVARATDDEGVHHRLWRMARPAVVEAISSAVASAPVVIADGHHRYETALAYRDERRAANGGSPGAYDAVMALVVELADDQLSVRPVHRLVSGLPARFDLVSALSAYFEPSTAGSPDPGLTTRMAEVGSPAVVTTEGAWLLRPRADTAAAAGQDLDSSLLEVALASLPPHEVTFEPEVDAVIKEVGSGRAQAGLLLRPATVAQIAHVAGGGERMPPKTTFFHPKPRTGMVFREVPG